MIAFPIPSYNYSEVLRVHPLKTKTDDLMEKHSPASFEKLNIVLFGCSSHKLQARALFPLPHCAKNDIFSGRILF